MPHRPIQPVSSGEDTGWMRSSMHLKVCCVAASYPEQQAPIWDYCLLELLITLDNLDF
jgi:hypothetical protein